MKLGHVELFVRDPKVSQRFFVEVLGFELTVVQRDMFVWLKSGGTEILLRPGKAQADIDSYGQSAAALMLYCDDLAGTMALLKSRGVQFRGDDGSPDCPTVTDPDGHWFQLVNPNG